MSDMTGLKEAILAQSHEKGRLKLAAAKESLKEEFKSQKQKLLAEKEALRNKRLGDIKRHQQRERQQLENQARQSSLATKQEVLKELFVAAQDRMNYWPEDKQVDFIREILARYEEPVTVYFGQLTAQILSESAWQDLEQAFPHIVFSSEKIPTEGGFIISKGNIDDNFLYSHLVAGIWESDSYRLSSEIFKS